MMGQHCQNNGRFMMDLEGEMQEEEGKVGKMAPLDPGSRQEKGIRHPNWARGVEKNVHPVAITEPPHP
jgi:hypothetical protein